MPTRPRNVCLGGCAALAVKGRRYCRACAGRVDDEHDEARARHDERRGSARDRGYDAAWDRLSKYVRQQEPVCRRCRNAVATLVDHVVPLRQGGARLDEANLQPLCVSCHAAKTAEDARRFRGSEKPHY